MKRSKNVRLVLAAGAMATTTMLAACGDGGVPASEMTSFSNVEQCVAAGYLTDACQERFQAAQTTYLEEAPKFNTLAACQEEYGAEACAPYQQPGQASQGGSVFMPLMTGFLISQALNGITDRGDYARYRDRNRDYFRGGYYGVPNARTASYNTLPGSFSTGARSSTALSSPSRSTYSVGTTGNRTVKATVPNQRTSTISRGGFGGRAAIRGGGFSA